MGAVYLDVGFLFKLQFLWWWVKDSLFATDAVLFTRQSRCGCCGEQLRRNTPGRRGPWKFTQRNDGCVSGQIASAPIPGNSIRGDRHLIRLIHKSTGSSRELGIFHFPLYFFLTAAIEEENLKSVSKRECGAFIETETSKRKQQQCRRGKCLSHSGQN